MAFSRWSMVLFLLLWPIDCGLWTIAIDPHYGSYKKDWKLLVGFPCAGITGIPRQDQPISFIAYTPG